MPGCPNSIELTRKGRDNDYKAGGGEGLPDFLPPETV